MFLELLAAAKHPPTVAHRTQTPKMGIGLGSLDVAATVRVGTLTVSCHHPPAGLDRGAMSPTNRLSKRWLRELPSYHVAEAVRRSSEGESLSESGA